MLGGMNEENERHRSAAHLLYELAKPLRVLSALSWEGRLREEFLARVVQMVCEGADFITLYRWRL